MEGNKVKKARVSVLMGSASDLEAMQVCMETLRELDVECEPRILSAHRTPDELRLYVQKATGDGVQVFIAAAGLAAHLAGAVAAHTERPVIGVPMSAGTLGGMDSLLSTVQMPAGLPVATVAIGKAGAVNAAILAAQILALSDENLAQKLRAYRQSTAAKVKAADKALQEEKRDGG